MVFLRVAVAGWLVVVASVVVGTAQGVDAPIERYREAVGFQQLGAVQGRAIHERRKPTGPDEPLAGTAVILLPRSDAWLLRMQDIKRGARDSADAYREAATLVRATREAYEKSLLEVGAGDLPQAVTVDAQGLFALENIPAGPWILFAYHQSYAKRTKRAPPQGPTRPEARPFPFLIPDRITGYYVITYWLRELTIAAGAVDDLDLTDRNAWFTGVSENRQPPPVPTQPTRPLRR